MPPHLRPPPEVRSLCSDPFAMQRKHKCSSCNYEPNDIDTDLLYSRLLAGGLSYNVFSAPVTGVNPVSVGSTSSIAPFSTPQKPSSKPAAPVVSLVDDFDFVSNTGAPLPSGPTQGERGFFCGSSLCSRTQKNHRFTSRPQQTNGQIICDVKKNSDIVK